MTRSRRRRQSAMLLLVSSILIVDACGKTPPPSVTVAATATQAQPTPRPTAFEPMTYPSGGDAPCDQAQPPDADHAAYAGLLRSIRAVDARTVEFQLCAPDVAFPVRLASAAGAVNDTAWLETHVDGGAGGEQAIVHDVNGTGPYRLEAWNRGSDIDLVRNDAYWGEPARNQRLIVRWRASASDRLAELQAGSVDGIDDVDPADVETVRNDVDLTALARPGINVFYVGFNDTYAPFDGAAVRRAIAMGIDRDRIVQALYPPGSEVASHVSPCAVPFGCGGSGWYEFDPFGARQMLADAGFPDGFHTTIQYREAVRPYLPDPTAVALELQAQLKANLNIRAELQVLPDAAYLVTVDAGRADGIHLLGRSASIPDASAILDPLFG
ncbi:MAG: ABC transporter substrate-binding protein, partial [Candidatus Limnocylindrales bacterium]